MLEVLFWLAVGAFVGWNFPQPSWAAKLQAKLVGLVKRESE